MKEIITLPETHICIKANYETTATPHYNKDAKPHHEAMKVAHETLSDLGWKLYQNLCNFPNHGVGVAPVTQLMNELDMNEEQFNKALMELIDSRYLNFRPIYQYDKIYTGNAFQFHDDNSLVAMSTDEFSIEKLNKPFFYTGNANVQEEW